MISYDAFVVAKVQPAIIRADYTRKDLTNSEDLGPSFMAPTIKHTIVVELWVMLTNGNLISRVMPIIKLNSLTFLLAINHYFSYPSIIATMRHILSFSQFLFFYDYAPNHRYQRSPSYFDYFDYFIVFRFLVICCPQLSVLVIQVMA